MFVGSVPRQAVQQIVATVPFGEWGEVFVGCSGAFRVDAAVKAAFPLVNVHSNDVSLLSCAVGALATGKEFSLTFKGRLAFMEDAMAGRPFQDRIAAVAVALEMAKYKGNNDFARAHFRHYQERFIDFHTPVAERLKGFIAGLTVGSFHAGDFREQGRRAAEAGGGVAAFPPTYKGGYEQLYRFLDEATDWERPAYDIWDPSMLEDWLDELETMGVRYCVLTDHLLERHSPATVFRGVSNKPVYTFADRAGSSVRRAMAKVQPFKYRPLDSGALTAGSEVVVAAANSAQMNFLKDIFLAKGIAHTSGIANFLVLIDGCLAGGFIFARDKYGGEQIYLLSDFALNPRSRVSKLIAMLATSATIIERLEVRLAQRIREVHTTAFTNRPVSMKYRGVFDLKKREPGKLHYASSIRAMSPAAIYGDWWKRFSGNKDQPGKAA